MAFTMKYMYYIMVVMYQYNVFIVQNLKRDSLFQIFCITFFWRKIKLTNSVDSVIAKKEKTNHTIKGKKLEICENQIWRSSEVIISKENFSTKIDIYE